MGAVFQEQRQWKQAEQYYQQALRIRTGLNDRYKQANIYHNLGTVSLEQRLWEQAEQYYQQALHIYVDFNDHYKQAEVYHNLGIVFQEQRLWEQMPYRMLCNDQWHHYS